MAAESSGSPYQRIVDRNIFGLKPPPPPESHDPPAPPPPRITLTGIFTILGTMPDIPGFNPLEDLANTPKQTTPTTPVNNQNTLPLPPGAARRYAPQ